jgi:YD repeat-containing protein
VNGTGNKTTTYAYDKAYRRTSTTYPNGVAMTTAYDPSGRITKIEGKKSTTTHLAHLRLHEPGDR